MRRHAHMRTRRLSCVSSSRMSAAREIHVIRPHDRVRPDHRRHVARAARACSRPAGPRHAAAAALKAMFAAAARDGVKLETVSGFRSMDYQTVLIRRKLKKGMTIGKAISINAVPGYSEHQTGCAVDLTTPGVPAADGSFANSKAFAWMQHHAARYGFHLSFPPGNKYG